MCPYFPDMLAGAASWDNRRDFRGLSTPKLPCFSYETGSTCRLTCQGSRWEPMLKYRDQGIAVLQPMTRADVSANI